MSRFLNIATYRFFAMDDLPEWRDRLKPLCRELGLKGTILLSPEGINVFVSGLSSSIERLLEELQRHPELEHLDIKRSYSDSQPFRRMLIRIKKEIIAFGVPGIDPVAKTTQKITAQQLQSWLAQGQDITLLDVRNNYEVQLGTFENALPIGVSHFREFPEALKRLPAEAKQKPVVMFCTGGIRCEKAGPLMEREGFAEVYQLDGGILRYFEICGDAYYRGECFVFDQRVALDSTLKESRTTQCFCCQSPLSVEDQKSAKYVVGVSCPYCFIDEHVQKRVALQTRLERIRQVTQPLPGAEPYTNLRPLNVPARFEGMTVIDFLANFHPHLPRQEWELACSEERILYKGAAVSPARIVKGGERYARAIPNTTEPAVNPDIEVLYEDDSIAVINKPAPLPVHPSGRFNRNTLVYILNQVYHPRRLRPAHRLDANTSGVQVFSLTRRVASKLQPQFEHGEVTKEYLVRANGVPETERFVSTTAISTKTYQSGIRLPDPSGLPSRTEFRLIRTCDDRTSYLIARPITGRTNQIRLHLWEMGLPVVGDPIFLSENRIGDTQTLSLEDPPLCLHALRIEFRHPEKLAPAVFQAPLPAWAEGELEIDPSDHQC